MQQFSEIFQRIKSNGIKDNLSWNNESEAIVLGDVLK